MALTIEQALQEGIGAHKEGNLQEAERLYRAILQTQPLNPDANHNLGVIALSVNKAKEAIPLFKTALEANPKIEQFWLSYIDVLIKENQIESAKEVLKQSYKQGIDEGKLNIFKTQITSTDKDEKTDIASPSEQQISTLLEYYRTGQYSDAEQLALFITKQFPKHPFAWLVLGAVLKQAGKNSEALNANQTAVAVSPQNALANNNYGITLKDLGRLKEAEASYRKTMVLKPEFAETYFNLGDLFAQLGKLEDAKARYQQALLLKVDYVLANSNLGITLKKLGRLEQAEKSYKKAIALRPDYAPCHNNLGIALTQLGRIDEAKESYKKAITLSREFGWATHMLAALTQETTETAPRDYVEGLFDNYASTFEDSLVKQLDYQVPRVIADIILKDSEFEQLGSILDLGCGTGLFGTQIKHNYTYLEGIDLSGNMLAEAKKKSAYSKLIKQDITDYLSNADLNFDYFVATDVFIYIGNLSDVFRLIKYRNQKGGKFVFSTEHFDGDGFFLEETGRYSHSKKYIEDLAKTFNYKICHFEVQSLRREQNKQINGGLYLLEF